MVAGAPGTPALLADSLKAVLDIPEDEYRDIRRYALPLQGGYVFVPKTQGCGATRLTLG